jgi:microcystin-dependent protein
MATPFLGEIRETAFAFAPPGWLPCDGRLLPIAQYEALYTLLGTTYGGDGITTFGIPDLQGRVPIHQGTQNNETYVMGQRSGTENLTLVSSQMAAHTHVVHASSNLGNMKMPTTDATWAQITQDGVTAVNAYSVPPGDTVLAPVSVSSVGGNQPFGILQPYLAVNYMIATAGIFPTQG